MQRKKEKQKNTESEVHVMNEKFSTKDLFTIPNIICYIRIILIPVFCSLYLTAHTKSEFLIATAVVVFSSLTDLFDGLIARKFNQVTELGKVLDPVADKLTHAAMAFCLASRYPLMWGVLVLMAIKEGYMGFMGIKYLKKGKMMNGAMWYGKVCTAVTFVCFCVLFLQYDISIDAANLILLFIISVMIFTFIKYVVFYKNMDKMQ